MKKFQKIIASLTSAAMVFGMVSLTPMSSFATTTNVLPSTESNEYAILENGNINEGWAEDSVMRFPSANASLESVSVDAENKIITLKNLVVNRFDFDGANWTIVFEGTENKVLHDVIIENQSYDPDTGATSEFDNTLTLKVAEGGKFTLPENAYFWMLSDHQHLVLGEGTTASAQLNVTTKTVTEEQLTGPDTTETVQVSRQGIHGPIIFTHQSDNTTTDDTTTDDTTTDDTTTDDATTDDDATTGDSTDDGSGSPTIIEGKNLSWNTVDSSGKSYWYENGVKQGTKDDPKAVTYDGTIRGREIYDPDTKSWYWLDADAQGARAVNKEVFVPYIYQDEKSLTDAQKSEYAAKSDGGLKGVGATVLDSMKNGKGKWVRYDSKGAMVKGWYKVEGADASLYPTQAGNTYYYDKLTGTMAKGSVVVDGVAHYFDPVTGKMMY